MTATPPASQREREEIMTAIPRASQRQGEELTPPPNPATAASDKLQ
jgi:hypothetical protein